MAQASHVDVGPSGAELSDAALIADFRGGSEAAFGELIRRHQIGVFRLLLGLLGSGDDAERECEKVFFEAARRIDEIENPDRFHAWVLGIAREAAQKSEAEHKAQNKPKKARPPARDPRAFVKQEVRDILSELSGDERLALILADLEGDSYEAIGGTLGTSAGEAQQIVESARNKFLTALHQRGGEGGGEPEAPLLEPGRVLGGRFRIEERLGKGGMGAVYRAVDGTSGQVVALKTLLPESAKDPSVRRRFEREAELLRRVEHPHFVRFVAAGQEPGEPAYVVMEFLDGDALSRVLRAERRLAPRRALSLTRQILHGLSHAHGLGVVHRDIKPDNVVLVPRDQDPEYVKILDLGIAKLVGPEDLARTRLTQKGELFGTPIYISPEQVRGEDVDGRADLYSLTVMLFEMLASRPPFESNTSMGLFAMHLATAPPPLSTAAPGLAGSAPLQALLDRGLAKDPAARFASAEQYLAGIDEVLSGDWVESASAGPLPEAVPAPAAARPPAPAARPAPAGTVPPRAPAGSLRSRLPWPTSRNVTTLVVLLVIALIGLLLWATWGFVDPAR